MTTLMIYIAVMVASTYLAGRLAETRGRSAEAWRWVAAFLIGPLALPLLYLLPARRGSIG